METYTLQEDLLLFGMPVTGFPEGIKEAFGSLAGTLGTDRPYYGISWFAQDGSIAYYAMAAETAAGEAARYDYETFILPGGEYRTEKIMDWMSRTDCIKEVFHRLMQDNNPTRNNPCIEWYQSDKEMLCMVRNA